VIAVPKTILSVSVAANFLFILGLVLRVAHSPHAPQPSGRNVSDVRAAERIVEKTTTTMIAIATAPRRLDWRTVESADYRKYIANLRDAGCPERTIRDIIVADVNELYRHRFLADFPITNRAEYWKPGDPLSNLIDEEQVARLQEFAKEKRDLVSALLGTDYSGEVELTSIQTEIFMERLLDFLTPEQRTAMKELESKYNAKLLNTVKDSVRGDNQSSKSMLAQKDEEVLKVLTPEEKFEYDLRRSNDSMFLRVALGDFELSEQEFRSVFPAMKQFIAEAGLPSLVAVVGGNGDPREQTLTAQKELENSLTSALGKKRFGDLMVGTGWKLPGDNR